MVDLSFLAEEPLPAAALIIGGLLSIAIALYGHRDDSHWDEVGTFFGFILGAVMFVMVIAAVATYLMQNFVLVPLGITFMRTITFILLIAFLVQMVEGPGSSGALVVSERTHRAIGIVVASGGDLGAVIEPIAKFATFMSLPTQPHPAEE